jgi:hypothetical protein
MQVPTDAQFFSSEDRTKPDIAFLKNHFYREGRLTEDQAIYILEKATEIIRAEGNVLSLNAPITGSSDRPRRHLGCSYFINSMRRHPWTIRTSSLSIHMLRSSFGHSSI